MERPRNNEQTNGNKEEKETGVLENGVDSVSGTRYVQDEFEV